MTSCLERVGDGRWVVAGTGGGQVECGATVSLPCGLLAGERVGVRQTNDERTLSNRCQTESKGERSQSGRIASPRHVQGSEVLQQGLPGCLTLSTAQMTP